MPAVTGLYPENPGVELYAGTAYIVPVDALVGGMSSAMAAMVRLGLKRARGERLGSALAEGYLPRGFRRNEPSPQPHPQRAVDMLLSKLAGRPYESEVPLRDLQGSPAADPITDLTAATVALVTEAGIVPRGNPDRIESRCPTRWGAYSIKDLTDLTGESHESIHGGYVASGAVQDDPDRALPVDVLRDLEREGQIAGLHDTYYATAGAGATLGTSRRFGQEIAGRLQAEGVAGAILTAT